ncbi:MAG: hypothetical protein KDA37_00725 [Planctomycetales bacterium]|nr:hypothetical protein [Planctomycetales bacterium]
MLRFDNPQTHAKPRNYLARGEQVRLLSLVVALALVGVAIAQVNSRRGGRVLAALFGGEPRGGASMEQGAEAGSREGATLSDAPSWLTKSQQETITDNTFFRPGESDAWLALLARLEQESPAPAEATHASYAQLARQPTAYRGRPVAVSGHIARVERETPAANDIGLEEYWRAIFRPEGGEVWPIAVYTLEKPPGIDDRAEPFCPGSAVGIFFKNLSYQSESGAGVMPVLLASSIQVDLPVDEASRSRDPIDESDFPMMVAIGLVIAAAVLLLIVLRERSR